MNKPLFGLIAILVGFISHGANPWFGDVELREPKAGRTLVFCRGQMKYGLDENYLDRWTDRPLFQDSSLRVEKRQWVMGQPSYDRMIRIAAAYELDGFAFLGETSGRIGIFDLTESSGIDPSFKLLPELVSWPELGPKEAMLERAIASPFSIRINDRIAITSYRADALPLETWVEYLEGFREKYGRDTFIFLPDITGLISRFHEPFHKGEIKQEEVEELKTELRRWATVWDGLYLAGAAAMKHDRLFDGPFYADFAAPALQSVMAEKAMADKYWGLSAGIGHENCTRLGYTLSHDGTRTLRYGLDIALAAKPDLLVLPEWDEQNENTSIRPTVYNGTTTQRIVRHAMQKLKGVPVSPIVGDNTAVPNLMISYRRILILGEKLQIELLNVPDGSSTEPATVRLQLDDAAGKRVWLSDPIVLPAATLTEQRIELPSEDFAAHALLRPRLLIERGAQRLEIADGLHHIRLRATWNWDYKWVKAALRDIVIPTRNEIAWQPAPDGMLAVTAQLDFPEPLASLEVVDEDQTVFAVSPTGDSLRERQQSALFAVEMRAFNRRTMFGGLSVTGAEAQWQPNQVLNATVQDGALRFGSNLDWTRRIAFLGIPTEQLNDATLKIDLDVAKLEIPFAKVEELGIWSQTIEDMTFTVSRYWLQPDHPAHLKRTDVSFNAFVKPALRDSVLHLRAIAKSGRIYRSAPHAVAYPTDESRQVITWSDSISAPVTSRVNAARVPELDYRFDSARGSVFHAGYTRLLRGHLGGYTDSVTNRGGDGGLDGSPFVRRTTYPEGVTKLAPTWAEEDGRTVLRFDGIGTYVSLPQGVLPRRSGFTMTMQLKPEDVRKPQVLLIHHGNYIGSISLRLENGTIRISHVNDQMEHFRHDTGLAMRPMEWQRLELEWDLSMLRVRLDDQEAGPYPASRPGLYDCTTVIGGFGRIPGQDQEFIGNVGWFGGWLRAFRMVHGQAR